MVEIETNLKAGTAGELLPMDSTTLITRFPNHRCENRRTVFILLTYPSFESYAYSKSDKNPCRERKDLIAFSTGLCVSVHM